MKVTVQAPVTLANFIVGFDTLGACLEVIEGEDLGDRVTIEFSDTPDIVITGTYAEKLPASPQDNIVKNCQDAFQISCALKGITLPAQRLILEKRLPVGSGLGSSASSIIAALAGLNLYHKSPLNSQELLMIAGEMEGVISGSPHFDNVAPCLLGGVQLVSEQGASSLPWFDEWLIVIYHPGVEISTKQAREILPKQVALKESITYWQRLAWFIQGLHQGDRDLVQSVLKDDLIEPYRGQLIPNFEIGRQAVLEQGALAFGISGSGPTCFAIASSLKHARILQQSFEQTMQGTDQAFSRICRIAPKGVKIVGEELPQ